MAQHKTEPHQQATPGSDSSGEDSTAVLANVRMQLGRRIYVVITWIVALVIGFLFWRGFTLGWTLLDSAGCGVLGLHLLIAGLGFARHRLRLQSAMVIGFITMITIIGILKNGVFGVAFILPAIMSLHLTLVHGFHVARLSVPFQALLLIILATVWLSGVRAPGAIVSVLNTTFAHWGIAIVASLGSSILMIWSTDYVIKSLTKTLGASERQKREIKKGESNYRDMLEFTPIPIVVIDREGQTGFVNHHFHQTFGYTLEDMPHVERWFELAYPEASYREQIRDLWMSRMAEAGADADDADIPGEAVFVRCADGDTKEVFITAKIQGDRIIVLFQDVTQMREARRELERVQRELMAAVEQSPAGILIADAPDVKIRLANSAALGIRGTANDMPLTGISVEDHVKSWQTYDTQGNPYTPEELPLSKAVLQGKTSSNVEVIIRDSTGNDRRVLANAGPIRNAEGEVVGGVVVFLDITEQRNAEEQLRQTQKMDAVGQLAGGIAHDFNNQLSGILGFAELLVDDLDDVTQRGYATRIVTAAERAAGLTRQLLAFSRRGEFKIVDVDLHQIIDEVSGMLEHTIDRRITIEQRKMRKSALTQGDTAQIQNAVLNLALNARDAMADGGELIFETDMVELDEVYCRHHSFELKSGNYIQLSVTDTGCGISHEDQEHIFEPFFTTKEEGRGTGMGLAAVYGTMKTHKGGINVYSELGRGTTFRLFFWPTDGIPLATGETELPTAPVNTGRIYVVDDEAVIRDMSREILSSAGFDVHVYKNGLDAMHDYETTWHEVALIILDLNMPKMNGPQTFKAIKQINPDAKVIIASGFAADGEAQNVLQEGAQAFVQKPFRKKLLIKTVAEALGS